MGLFTRKEEDGSRTGRLTGRQVWPSDKQRERELEGKDRIVEKSYRDYDLYDWSGKQVDKGSDVRRRGSDR